MSVPYPLINGVRHAWSSVEAKVRGKIYLGVKSHNYNDTLEPSLVRGTHPQPLALTLGDYTAEADIEFYLAEANAIMQDIGNGIAEEVIDFITSYSATGLDTIVDSYQARIKKVEASGSQGPDALTRKFTLQPVGVIKWDGLTLLSNPLGGSATR